MPIAVTRALVAAALDGSLNKAETRKDDHFGFAVPLAVDGVPATLLNPRDSWKDPAAYDQMAARLVGLFQDNARKFETPARLIAAE
jgi:phosphoenolpyruvate carboxykinase (ATP)